MDMEVRCSAGISHFLLYPNGDIYRCMADYNARRQPLGNLLTDGLKLPQTAEICTHPECYAACDTDWATKWIIDEKGKVKRRIDAQVIAAEKDNPRIKFWATQDYPDKLLKKFAHVAWSPSLLCNYDCEYCGCAHGFKNIKEEFASSFPELTPEQWVSAFEKYLVPNFEWITVDVTGGEPVLSKSLTPVLKIISEKCGVNITTNLSVDVMDFVKEGIKPLDAETVTGLCFTGSLHPMASMFKLKTFLTRLLYLKNNGFPCRVNFVAYPEQMYAIDYYRALFNRYGIEIILCPWCGTDNYGRSGYLPEEKRFLDSKTVAWRKTDTQIDYNRLRLKGDNEMDKFGMENEEISVGEIANQLRDNIRERMGVEDVNENMPTHQDLNLLNQSWHPLKRKPLPSQKRYVGPFVTMIKQAIWKLTRAYNTMIFHHQIDFNANVTRILNDLYNELTQRHNDLTQSHNYLTQRHNDLTQRHRTLYQRHNVLTQRHNDLDQRYTGIQQENILQKRRLDTILSELREKYNLKSEGVKKLLKHQERLSDHRYFRFENIYRGKSEEIKAKQGVYLPIFKGASNVLDIGCGRGEFLEILKENGISAKGVDLNEDMIYICKEKGLDVQQIDAFTYLQSIEDNSLGGVFASQLVEHLTPGSLIDFIKLSYEKLEKGAQIIAETINPLCITALVNFYLDISHTSPLHPEAIKFLMGSEGFREIEIKFLSPVSEGMKLERIDLDYISDAKNKRCLEIINGNIERLNKILFGYQDYAVVARKI